MKLQAFAALVNSVVLLLPQVTGLFVLDATGYGTFSLVYLVYALGTSLSLSTVLEAWTRSKTLENTTGGWPGYSSMLVLVALLSAGLSAAVALFTAYSLLETLLTVAAVFLAVYRFGARYYEVQTGLVRRSVAADVTAVVGMALGIVLLLIEDGGIAGVFGMWAFGQFAGLLVGLKPTVPSIKESRQWLRDHAESIRPLLKDSLLMDASAVGTPYVLTGLLGVAGIGIYRAVSSVSAPVRLILTALRPILARVTPARLRRPTALAAVAGVTVVPSIAVYGVLLTINSVGDFGVVGQLEHFAIPTALFVGANFIGQFYAISMRINAPSSRTLQARILQSGLAMILPLGGALVWGLSGAIWGYSFATVIAARNWMRQGLRVD